jgi:hypothetical protein
MPLLEQKKINKKWILAQKNERHNFLSFRPVCHSRIDLMSHKAGLSEK